jgi:integrase
MRVFQTTYKYRSGKRCKARRWYIEFQDHMETRRRIPALEDRKQSEAIGRLVEKLVAHKVSREPLTPALSAWLEGLPNKLRGPLARIGLLDATRLAALQTLHDHLEDFRAFLAAKGNTARHVELVTARARRVIDGCRFVFWSDVSASKVAAFLADKRVDRQDAKGNAKRGLSAQTSNFYLQSFKSFCRFMVKDGRAIQSPVAHLDPLNVKTDRRRDRRALTVEELRTLLETTRRGSERFGMSGPERTMLYRLAVETGLRRGELESLTRSSFTLDAKAPTVTVAAGYSKHRHEDVLSLRLDTAAELAAFLACKMPNAPAFNMPPSRKDSAVMFRQDVEAAGLPYVDDAGHYADFHSLRHTTGSLLAAAGVHPKVAQSIMRHGTIELTMSRYSHVFAGQESDAMAALPDLSAPAHGAALMQATDNVEATRDATGCPRNEDHGARQVSDSLAVLTAAQGARALAQENERGSVLASCLAQCSIPGAALLDSVGRTSENDDSAKDAENTSESASFQGESPVADVPGRVRERLNRPVLKTGEPVRAPWVRIPPLPLGRQAAKWARNLPFAGVHWQGCTLEEINHRGHRETRE